MSKVFVLDTYENPLNPVHPGRARILLSSGKAAVFRRFPFTIILKVETIEPQVEPLRLKLDPGSKTTGIAIVNDASGEVVFAAELSHRGQTIKTSLDDRRAIRRSRRNRHTRYRKPRFDNRKRAKGWLPPSIESRIYRIPGSGGLVKVYEKGCAVMELCLQPAEPLPDGDVVVMHKLMIEANEQEYLQKANHFAPGIISLRCQHL